MPLIRVALCWLITAPLLGASPLCAQDVTELYVIPDTLRLKVGAREALSVQAFDASGSAVLAIGYRSADDRVARVLPEGAVVGVAPGVTRVSVNAGKKTHAVVVIVSAGVRTGRAPAVVSVAIQPDSLLLLPAEHGWLEAQAVYADGLVQADPKARWSSAAPAVAWVQDSAGLVTGVAAGRTTVGAVVQGVSAAIPVTVERADIAVGVERLSLAAGDSAVVTVSVPAQDQRRLRNSDLAWRSTDTTVARVTPDGIVRALAAGRADLIVSGFGQERRIPVLVHRPIVAFLTRPPLADTVEMSVDATRRFEAHAEAADSSTVSEAELVWQLSDSSVATFDPKTGILQAKKEGVTALSFTVPGFLPKSWTIHVVQGALRIDPLRRAISRGQRVAFRASYLDDRGQPVGSATDLTWNSSNLAVATVDSGGMVRAIDVGRSTISAVSSVGWRAGAVLFVAPDLLVTTNRGGGYGLYGVSLSTPDRLIPVIVDTAGTVSSASFSPDRTRIAYTADRAGGSSHDLFVADADGRNPVRLTSDARAESDPVWAPDGRQVVFVAAQNGNRQLYAVNVDGSGLRQLTSLPNGAQDPAVSPDGARVAFTAFPKKRDEGDIYTVPLRGGPVVNVTGTERYSEHSPAWLPDGSLAWAVDTREKRNRYKVIRAKDDTRVTLNASDTPIIAIAVSRNGAMLAWTTGPLNPRDRGVSRLFIGPLTSAIHSVPLLPGERVSSLSF